MASTSSTPVDLLSQKRHPLEHLSKMFSFCNPESEANTSADDDDNHDGLQSKETILSPGVNAQEQIVASSKSIVVQDFEGEVETQLETLPTSDSTSSSSVVVDPPTPQPPVTSVRLGVSQPEGILKTDKDETKKKKKTAVVVDSGRGHRVNRIVETAIFTILVVCATMLALQRLGHETEINFNPSSPSSPIKFDMRMDDIVKPTEVEVVALNDTTTTAIDIDSGTAPRVDEPVAVEESVEKEVTTGIAEQEEGIQNDASDKSNTSPGENDEEDSLITEDRDDTDSEEL